MANANHILFVLDYFHPHIGGVENLFKSLAHALAQRGHVVSVITLWLPGTRQFEVTEGVEILRVRTPFSSRYLFALWALRLTLRKAREADFIHTTLYSAALPAFFGALFSKKKAVLTLHEVLGDQWVRMPGMNRVIGVLSRLFEWLILHLPFAHYICDSNFTKWELLKVSEVPEERTSVIYPPLDYSFWHPLLHRPLNLRRVLKLDRDSFIYLYFGRPDVSKGVEYLLEAAVDVRKHLRNSRLLLLLARDPRKQYRKILRLIKRLGLSDHVTILSPVPREQIPGYLLASDCVVLPSLFEGFGYPAVEAANLGCRVIATAGHAVEEILKNHVTLVPSGDSRALAVAIVESAVFQEPFPRPERRFTIDSHVKQVLDVYEKSRDMRVLVGVG
jgi:D-inositol-3-phosphate glycosyltransferase